VPSVQGEYPEFCGNVAINTSITRGRRASLREHLLNQSVRVVGAGIDEVAIIRLADEISARTDDQSDSGKIVGMRVDATHLEDYPHLVRAAVDSFPQLAFLG